MDRRLHILLLSGIALAGFGNSSASAQEAAAAPETPQVVEPQVERREVQRPEIDTENFEAGAFIGTISIEDFGSSFVYGASFAYHFTEDVFAEATIGTADAGRTSYEDLSGSVDLLTDSERTFTYYDLAAGCKAWGLERGRVVGVGCGLVVIPGANASKRRVHNLLWRSRLIVVVDHVGNTRSWRRTIELEREYLEFGI